jgi:hypothetical protein
MLSFLAKCIIGTVVCTTTYLASLAGVVTVADSVHQANAAQAEAQRKAQTKLNESKAQLDASRQVSDALK